MNEQDFSIEFGKRYRAAPDGTTVVAMPLFGIEFATELEGHNLKSVCANAEVPVSFATELRKKMRLADFVHLK